MTPDRPRPGLAARLTLALVLLFAGAAAGYSATYGVHEDSALSYAIALRHLEGQLPYRDYVVPHGPIAGVLITPFFWLPVSGGWSFVIATGALNAAAAFLVWKIVARVSGDWVTAAVGATATGAWFLPAFGAYYHDYVSYLFVLLAVWAYVAVPHQGWRAALAGAALALAYHCKQTFGAAGSLAFAIVDVAFAGRREGVLLNRRLLPFVAGYLGGHLLVLAGLAACGGLGNWWLYSVRVPADFAADPAQDKSTRNLWLGLLWPFKIDPTLTSLPSQPEDKLIIRLFAPVLGLVYLLDLVAVGLFLRRFQSRGWALAGALGLLVPFLGAAVELALEHESAAKTCGLVLAAVAAALAGWILARKVRGAVPASPAAVALAMFLLTTVLCASNSGRRCTELGLGLGGALALAGWLAFGRHHWPVVILLLAFSADGLTLSHCERERAYDLRRVLVTDSDLRPVGQVFNAEGLTGLPEQELQASDMDAVYEHLASTEGRFAVIDDKGFFLPLLLRRADWGLNVYFHDGLTVPRRPDLRRQWQEQYIASLERAGVTRLVWCLGAGLRDFRLPPDPNGGVPDTDRPVPVAATVPLLTDYLNAHFELEFARGPFRVLRRK